SSRSAPDDVGEANPAVVRVAVRDREGLDVGRRRVDRRRRRVRPVVGRRVLWTAREDRPFRPAFPSLQSASLTRAAQHCPLVLRAEWERTRGAGGLFTQVGLPVTTLNRTCESPWLSLKDRFPPIVFLLTLRLPTAWLIDEVTARLPSIVLASRLRAVVALLTR